MLNPDGLSAKRLMRPIMRRHSNGAPYEDFTAIPVCDCIGMAVHLGNHHFSEGRRGPPGGVCGACGGAIHDKEGK